MAETSFIIDNGRRVNLKDAIARKAIEELRQEVIEGGGTSFEVDETLILKDGVLSVNTADVVEADNTLPVTSAAVQVTVGNIDALLQTI